MRNAAHQTRANRTITINFHNEATSFQLLSDSKAFVECVLAFVLALGFHLAHKAICRGDGCLTRHSHDARVRLGGLTIWRLPCTAGKAVVTVPAAFRLAGPPDATRCGPRCLAGHPRGSQSGMGRGTLQPLADGALSLGLCVRPPPSGDDLDPVWLAPTRLFPRR
jgi:hypothetical protein